MVGGAHAQAALYHLVARRARPLLLSRDMKDRFGDHVAYDDVPLDRERMRRWSPLNQSLYYGYKVHLAGQLLNYKGDRVAMANSVETRYPLPRRGRHRLRLAAAPRWKLRGLRDKYLLCARPPRACCRARPRSGEGHVPRAARRDVPRQCAAVRAPADEPRGAAQDRLLRSRDRAAATTRSSPQVRQTRSACSSGWA